MKIVAVGPLWRGSNAGGLFRALSREGCVIEVLDEFYYLSLHAKTMRMRLFGKAVRSFQEAEFNTAIREKITLLQPDILLVYKGAFVRPETLHFARQKKCKLVLFYPDVSTTTHGPNIPASIPHYDLIFTTKTFAITDLEVKYKVKNTHFIPHGFDPELHRKLPVSADDRKTFGCDVSFIGTWSPKKEAWLAYLKEHSPGINMKIWGGHWGRASNAAIKDCIQNTEVYGDMYAIAIQCSTINLGILSEQVSGASSGDLITSRTFHIPGASGFMLHERNEESVQYFIENEEAGFFIGEEEMTQQVKRYLADAALRTKIQQAGHKRALKDHSLDSRARSIVQSINEILYKA